MDRGLFLKTAAAELGVDLGTLENWEMGRHEPELRSWPAILTFLGYDPRPTPTAFGERIKAARIGRGWTRERLGAELGLDESTVQSWETDSLKVRFRRPRRLFEEFLERADCA